VTRAPARAKIAAAVLALAAGGCGGGQVRVSRFSTDWTDDGGASIGRVWDRVGSAAIPPDADVVVGVAGHTDKLVGLPLGGGSKWTFAHPIDSRPIVTGGVVVASGGGEVFALDAKTGAVVWRRPTGGIRLLGAGDDGAVTVVTLKRNGGVGSTLLAITHDGGIVQQIETDKPIGAPAVIEHVAFVPWAGQYVSVIDLSSGDEIARATLREQTSRAFTEGGSIWFGQASFVRFDAHVRDASKGQATKVGLPVRELPGTPVLMTAGSDPTPALAGAQDRVHLYARLQGSDAGGAVSDDRWYATYFRLAMGFATGQGKLAWVHTHTSDFLGGAAGPGGVVLCDEQGKVTMLDAKTGGVTREADVGEALEACVVSDDALAVGGAADAKPLAQQLAEAVTNDDLQLVVAQKLLLRELSSMEDETATKTLVDLASDPRTSPDMLPDARTALANRRNGASYMEAALARHYDYLKDVLRPPPVGPIAQALGAMKEKGAAALLASHLLDPADTVDDVKQAAAALAVVAGPEQIPALKQFFGMYRARAGDDDMAAAVVSAGQALVAQSATTPVAVAAQDDTTVPYAKERLQAVLAAAPPPSSAQAPAPKTKKP
jgi:outer membrane protein assembly factor BamB